ncbi:MAG: hypothetical protein OEW15_10330 [Nitrospirota bacterium]|nr:hypothetical protein [Nitrospirota bacterium]
MRNINSTTALSTSRLFLVILSMLLALTAGCAEKGPILIEGITYQTPEGAAAGKGNTVAAVSTFRDLREVQPSVIGKRQIGNDISNDLVVQGTAADMVTGMIREALKVRGIEARSAAAWDLSDASINAEGADILVGGEIKALRVEVISQPFKVRYKAMVQLRVSAADVKERKVLRTLNLSSSLEQENVSYSDYIVQEMLSEALSSSINQLLSDEEIKNRIR